MNTSTTMNYTYLHTLSLHDARPIRLSDMAADLIPEIEEILEVAFGRFGTGTGALKLAARVDEGLIRAGDGAIVVRLETFIVDVVIHRPTRSEEHTLNSRH